MDSSEHFLQTDVYFKKLLRISVKEKFWKFICFAAIIAVIVGIVLGKDALGTFDTAHSGFFTITSACIWIGIFNSIQSICKEHEIIRSEYRAGMRLSSYIFAHVRWQFLLSLMESIVVYIVLLAFQVLINPHGSVKPGPIIGYFITILLLTYGASLMGIMVSSIAGTPTTAMTIMPFVLIIQLVLCGVLFELDGVMSVIAVITFSKWGMSAFGSLADLNNRETYPLEMVKSHPELGGMNFDDKKPEFDPNFLNVLGAWAVILLIAAVCVAVAILSLKIKNRGS